MSRHSADIELPEIDKSEIAPGKWVLFNDQFMACGGRWGETYAANINLIKTGIRNWTFDHFKRAIKEGKQKGPPNGRMLLPPMPGECMHTAVMGSYGNLYVPEIPAAIDNVVPMVILLDQI